MAICKAYDKLDGRYFANFIDENFESMFAVADKGKCDYGYKTEIQDRIQQWLVQQWIGQTVSF